MDRFPKALVIGNSSAHLNLSLDSILSDMILPYYVNKDTDFNYMEIDVYCELYMKSNYYIEKDPKSSYSSLWALICV